MHQHKEHKGGTKRHKMPEGDLQAAGLAQVGGELFKGGGQVFATVAQAEMLVAVVIHGGGEEHDIRCLHHALAEVEGGGGAMQPGEGNGAGFGPDPGEAVLELLEKVIQEGQVSGDPGQVLGDDGFLGAQGDDREDLAGSTAADGGVVFEGRQARYRSGSLVSSQPILAPASPKVLDMPNSETARSYNSYAEGSRSPGSYSKKRYISSENRYKLCFLAMSITRW